MASPTSSILSLLLLLALANTVVSSAEVIRMYPKQHIVRAEGDPECESWKYSVEVNNAGPWYSIPRPCLEFVREYFNTGRYLDDSRSAAAFSLTFAKSVKLGEGKGMDAWIFDVDETLLSNLPYYEDNGFGTKPYNETSFNEWVEKGLAPALPASLSLYKSVKKLGFKIFILTGRGESQRAITARNLIDVGYSGWEKLILRGLDDEGKKATVYKSEKRAELMKQGYTIQGSSGDQWSDLIGFALAKRSFKLPNPMSKPPNVTVFYEWVNKGVAPALPASLTVYKWVKKLGFKIFIISGRHEYQRAVTEQNLIDVGYFGWEKLILRGPEYEGNKATVFKSEQRAELVKQGYTIQGNSGDQWSDLTGSTIAKRSFKLPNLMYHVH